MKSEECRVESVEFSTPILPEGVKMTDRQYHLYHKELEHDSCGVGAVVDLNAKATHRTVDQALCIVERLAHRAGSDAEGTT